MSTNRVQNGRRLQHTLTAIALSGSVVVVGTLVCVATEDGAIGDSIALAVGEVYDLPKVDGAVIVAGERVIYDVSAAEVDDENATPAAGDVSNFGVAWEGKGATTGENIAVLLTPGTGTVT